jgi:adenylosuccinate lyase
MTRDNSILAENISAKHLALGPLDGRYSQIGEKLAPYFSEYALVKNRVKVEVYWLKFLLENVNGSDILDAFDIDRLPEIMAIYTDFSDASYVRVKEIESVTNHDVKSVELFVAEKLKEMGMDSLVSFVHIGCTSEDITNPSYANMISTALKEVWIPAAEQLIDKISEIAINHANTAMLAHTHGQPATPTTIGKEMTVYSYRLKKSLENIKSIKTCAKFNGATGNYAAISVAFPNENWPVLAKSFIEEYLELEFNPVTTQIESHDYVCHILDGIRHFNNVLRDFDLDMWLYISMEYFKQIAVKTEVGSSTMPHKVNPIRFENSEANIKMGNGICSVLSDELPRSRMQRDLSDSSLQRNIGLAFGYSIQAIEQTIGGLKKVAVNTDKISSDLDSKWEVLAEPIQTVLRKYGIPDAYNQLKELTRGKNISKESIQEFIKSLDVISDEDKSTLLALTPSGYIGLAGKIVEDELVV